MDIVPEFLENEEGDKLVVCNDCWLGGDYEEEGWMNMDGDDSEEESEEDE